MAFHDVRFPTSISLGAQGGPERRTEIVALASGREERNSPWAHARRRYYAGYGVASIADIETVIAFFEARRGRLHAFRWRDPIDWRSSAIDAPIASGDQPLGVGDGVEREFQLKKRYVSGGVAYERPVEAPDPATVVVAVDGAAATDFSISALGRVAFDAAPGPGAILTAGFEFDVPARFDTDYLAVNLQSFGAGEIPSIPVVEVRL